ncbi:hypothetical protein THOM_0694 [Trachipleistophora hominis]|uniref:Uncharacterized protein n=1 Tax=Trachipleistophora hominis TaxID=72359 RepID=L7JXX9_TRAHO|nr:hypothetical protein THOM_0694 [Trachipleistophora hominis]
MRHDILKPRSHRKTKLASLPTAVPLSFTRINQKKMRIERPWSRWKRNTRTGIQCRYDREESVLMDRYDGLDEGIKRLAKVEGSLVDVLKNKMRNDELYRNRK